MVGVSANCCIPWVASCRIITLLPGPLAAKLYKCVCVYVCECVRHRLMDFFSDLWNDHNSAKSFSLMSFLTQERGTKRLRRGVAGKLDTCDKARTKATLALQSKTLVSTPLTLAQDGVSYINPSFSNLKMGKKEEWQIISISSEILIPIYS